MNTLLSIANGALQYHRGKQTGFAGLMGIAFAIFCAYQWDHIYPILKALGIVDFFKRNGLVYDEPGLTGFAIFMFIFRLSIFLAIVLLILIVIAVILTMIFSNEKIGLYVILPFLFVIAFPFVIIYYFYQLIFNRKKLIENAEKEKMLGTPQEQLLRDHSEEIPREQALSRLNRIPTEGDRFFLLGVTDDNKLYSLLPRPINFETVIKGSFENTVYHKGDLVGLQYSVEKYVETKHKPKSMFDYVPKMFFINRVNEKREVISSDRFVAFYQTNCDDMLQKFRTCGGYSTYSKETQNAYFTKKETILTNMKNATEKSEFDNLVNLMSMFDASNDEIVKMMLDNEKQMKEEMEF